MPTKPNTALVANHGGFWEFFQEMITDLAAKTSVVPKGYKPALADLLRYMTANPAAIQPEMGIKRSIRNRFFHGDGKARLAPPAMKRIRRIKLESLPSRFTLRDEMVISSPKMQGFCNTCVAFAVIAAIEAQQQLATGQKIATKEYRYSEQFLYYYSIVCESMEHGYAGDLDKLDKDITYKTANGWSITDALMFCSENGVAEERAFPYNPYNHLVILPLYKIKVPSLQNISGWNPFHKHDNRIWEMKSHLAAKKGCILFSFSFRPDFFTYTKGIYAYHPGSDDQSAGGHAVCCIGYDDKKRAWHCKNSWGTKWGEEGFFWLDYAYPFYTDSAYSLAL